MIDERYYVKIVPRRGETVHRFEIRREHIVASLAVIAIACLSVLAVMTFSRLQVARLNAQNAAAQSTLKRIDQQTDALRRELQHVQKQNQEIRQLIGVPPSGHSLKTSWRRATTFEAAEARMHALFAASKAMKSESDVNRRLAMHVLNIRHVRELARARLIAAIPSIEPVNGDVVGCFCYRTYPDVEFHKGIDLAANWGDVVRASAAGTVVFNGWDGGYGVKVDIDHGNGYHTWYAHLSRVDVRVGSRVYKGEPIAAVGSTGFSTGPHLHYQVMYNGTAVNPEPFLHGVPANVLASLP